MIHGIDVSSAQATGADWKAAFDSGVRYAWIKASEGNTGRDPAYRKHLEAASLAGVWCGAYHFCRPNFGGVIVSASQRQAALERDAKTEAQNFWQACAGWGRQSESLPPLLDVESFDSQLTSQEFVEWIHTFAAECTQLWDVLPVIYTGAPMRERGGKYWDSALWLAQYPLMIAAYPYGNGPRVGGLPAPLTLAEAERRAPPSLKPWAKTTVWQFSGGSMDLRGNTCAGFGSVPIDRSVAYVDSLDELRLVCKSLDA